MTKKFSTKDLEDFALLTGDANPVHFDEAFAATTRFGSRIVHGMLSVCMIPTIIATKIPGSVYVSQNISFKKPVYLGDEITTRVEVLCVVEKNGAMKCRTWCVNQKGDIVVDGDARVLLPAPAK